MHQESFGRYPFFSDAAKDELRVLLAALEDIMARAFGAFIGDDPAAAMRVEPLEETIDHLSEDIRARHIHRLQRGECTIQLGFVLSDLLTNCERVSDHCSNLAVSVIEERGTDIARHAYLHDVKDAAGFVASLEQDMSRYQLPNT